MRKPRLATPEETRLWRSAMRDVAPLRTLPPLPEPAPVAAPLEPPPPAQPTRRPNGVDGRTLRQLARGERTVEAVIDLHGMTLELAHAALKRFIDAQMRAEKRCLLVITGKGGPDRPGRLKREVPLWLAEWRPPVLAVVPAAPRHGGGGAFYALLQRRR
jgi:DNA-nicking Smr family endonuclease